MNKHLTHLAVGLAALMAVMASQAGTNEAKAAYYAAADKAAADYRDAHAACELLDASMQAVCIEEAKLAQTRAKGNAEAHYRNTAQARQKADIDIANAEFSVAKARCEFKEGSDRQACLRQAEITRAAMIGAAKVGHKTVTVATEGR